MQYGCEIWSLILKGQCNLRILRTIFGRKRDEDGEWRRLNNLYPSPNSVIKSSRLRWAGHVAKMEEGRSGFKLLTVKPTGKFVNRILRRIFEPKRDANGEWRRLHNVELHSLYRSPNIVKVIKSRS